MANKKKLSKPTVTISRDGYRFTVSLSCIDSDTTHFWVEKWVYEKKDTSKSAKEYSKSSKISVKKNTSWSFTIDKKKYYPYVKCPDDKSTKDSDLDQRISKILVKVHTEGETTWKVAKKKNGKVVKNKKGKVQYKEEKHDIKGDTVSKEYKFSESVKPKIKLEYNRDGTSLKRTVSFEENHELNDDVKNVTTRMRVWLKRIKKEKGAKEEFVDNPMWINSNRTLTDTSDIRNVLNSETPYKYIARAYGAGPGGKSDVAESTHIFARPNEPPVPTIKTNKLFKNATTGRSNGIYTAEYAINTDSGWRPVDSVTIQYRDQDDYKGDSDANGENTGSWSTAADNIAYHIKNVQTNELGYPADDTVRYFRLLVEHDGFIRPSAMTGVVEYGKPSSLNVNEPESTTVGGKNALVFSWTHPSTKLDGLNSDTVLVTDAGTNVTLGSGGRARIKIFKNNLSNCIKTIKYGDEEWQNNSWVYYVQEEDLDKDVDFCFQVWVGLDNKNPGACSDNTWIYNVEVPSKCTNVKGNKLANNTTVELTWDNPIKNDTAFNGVEIAWSTLPNVFESNASISSVSFDNGAMTKAYITGLTAGEMYYFWVRRTEEKNGVKTYGLWSDISPGVAMSDKPDIPALSLSRSWIKVGGNLQAQWVYSANGNIPQQSAQIEINDLVTYDKLKDRGRTIEFKPDAYNSTGYEKEYEAGKKLTSGLEYAVCIKVNEVSSANSNVYLRFDSTINSNIYAIKWQYSEPNKLYLRTDSTSSTYGVVIGCYHYDSETEFDANSEYGWFTVANITGEETKCDVDLGGFINGRYKWPSGNYYLRVIVTNSMGTSISDPVDLMIAEKPNCFLLSTSLVDYSYDSYTESGESTEILTAKTLRNLPLDVNVDGEGDMDLYIYCIDAFERVRPYGTDRIFNGDCVWTSEVNAGTTSISKVSLVDGCSYRLQLECTDPNTNMKAESKYVDFEVHWEHQAVPPVDSTVDIVDGKAILTPVKPEGADDTDVCDIYRSTADGRYLVMSGVKWGTTIIDDCPTFVTYDSVVDTSYCFCTRTVNGDEAFVDILYYLEGTGAIINYGVLSISLPWNLTNDDSRNKKGEIRSHLGGSKTYYGQPFIDRSQSLNAELIKYENEDLIEQLYDLSRYPEICYVRTSNGLGYPATVDVSINQEYNNQIVSVSLSVKEADGEGEYLGRLPENGEITE